MDHPDTGASQRDERVVPRSHRLVRRLCIVYAPAIVGVVLLMSAATLPEGTLAPVRALGRELLAGGSAGAVLAVTLLALTSLLGTLALTATRFRYAAIAERAPDDLESRPRAADPGFAARQGQAIVVSAGALLIILVAWLLPPSGAPASEVNGANIAAAFIFALAFVSLVAERIMNEFPAPQLPEAPALRRLLLLTTLVLAATACAELGRAAGWSWVRWALYVLIAAPCVIALELALRALARLFLPPPQPQDARAVTDSLVAGVLTGGPRSPGTILRAHLGLDFTRSWALQFLSAAILPALFGTALLCWALSGVKLIDLGERGVYERFGAPIEVLGPGLHVLLPWPLGRLRPVEFGAIHAVAIGVDQAHADDMQEIAAEVTPPASLNRLWESTHPGQASYLVPSLGSGQQGFQSVSTEISVLYRVGLTDTAALDSVYTIADPESLIREAASRLVLRYFNSRTLETVLGARRENVASSLREALTQDMDAHHAGIDIVSVLIEEIHPPLGAAAAYHAVQAAEINANASISNERGRAQRVAGVAQQEAHVMLTASSAKASETLHVASAEAYRFNADRRAYGEGGRSFMLERSFATLKKALGRAPLTIVDHRLSPGQGPVFDLRSPSGVPRGAAPPPSSPAAATPAPPNTPASGATPPPYTPAIEDQN
jgi:regulator of protease activity HflC (stomatin/prohibitin superfamily)